MKVAKKRAIISYQNLSEELQELFHEEYADGYSNAIQKITKPSGEPIFVVPFETEDSIYMVKVEVRIDNKLSEEEFEKEILSATTKSEPEFESEEDEEGENKKPAKDKFVLVHGDYSDKNDEEEEEEDKQEEEEN